MPELPDLVVYIESLRERITDSRIERVRIASSFVVRSVAPTIDSAGGKRVANIERLGKRIVLGLEEDLFLVVHLMVSGRLQWRDPDAKIPGRIGLAAFDFPGGTLLLTEAGRKKRASITLVEKESALRAIDRGGIEPLEASLEQFSEAILRENHTLKRTLTDPRLVSGIGNAYSDEILYRARLSPIHQTSRLTEEEITRLHTACEETLTEWIERLRLKTGLRWPSKVTSFHEEMAVHGRYGKPCRECGSTIQRIVYADNETNYCPRCQAGGRLLADRALSRILRHDWPRRIEQLEES